MYAIGTGYGISSSFFPAPPRRRSSRITATATKSRETSRRNNNALGFSIPNPIEEARAAAVALCDTVENLIATYIDPREFPPSQDPKIQLADNFAPVGESPPTPCRRVTGEIPRCLRGGAYIRNGSNPLHPPPAGYHYFDGHGMLHAIKFPGDDDLEEHHAPIYCARFTQTNRFLQEQVAGKILFPYTLGTMSSYAGLARLGLFAMRAALGLIDILGGMGTSNAGMAYFDRRILAMSEDDMPYAVNITPAGDLITMGRYSFNKRLLLPMCAHPKIDPTSGELFAFSFNPVINPHLRYFWASREGRKSPDFDVWLREPCLFHDFAITENYAIFPENQVVMKIQDVVLQNKMPIRGDTAKVPRFGVIPRIPTVGYSGVRWIDVPDWTSFHYINAWEEGTDKIVVLSSSITPVECLFDDVAGLSSRLHEIHLDLRSGRSWKQHVCSAGLDFGQINQKFLGRKNRYVYMCYYGPWPKFSGLAKVDLDAPRLPRVVIDGASDPDLSEPCIVASRRFEPGRFCNEPFFVAKGEEEDEEDDGYVLSYVHDEKSGVSELLIMDAKSPTLETVASIELPARVPYGFHGIFVNAYQIANQNHVTL
ncbi:9-cis-epoxycarotenoid dioxygenase NCED4, chloroplastic [Selaginella moellendorffii]|uniref:9-cis-epoxycarotenoid dioxygenase NCED4, chloroplastic n=1 Tax=Selaginella moellendorffii TaxID=88036 RepID=UPI000D1C94EF|nr:9-cis-epoxycarotenoid dioxygenase NCED4, chloroplastic [Selaginella moellendorffii]|eukprot:XP_024531420.1 9-cis-epoxycarotenoid dioxygenase NCED4, chloroplastic [Selaginella moellendorffii]